MRVLMLVFSPVFLLIGLFAVSVYRISKNIHGMAGEYSRRKEAKE